MQKAKCDSEGFSSIYLLPMNDNMHSMMVMVGKAAQEQVSAPDLQSKVSKALL